MDAVGRAAGAAAGRRRERAWRRGRQRRRGAGAGGAAVAARRAGGRGGAIPARAARAASAASDGAPVFDGTSGYVEIPDDNLFSEPTSGAITVEAWMRPDSTAMPRDESGGYVHWMGKGVSGQHEWVARMYQDGNSEGRENRISFYSFNLTGGLGAGSYFQDTVTVGGWIHYAGEFDDVNTYIFKNGVLRDMDPLSGYDIVPGNGTAPVRIGTRDFDSFFQGSVARVAIYRRACPRRRWSRTRGRRRRRLRRDGAGRAVAGRLLAPRRRRRHGRRRRARRPRRQLSRRRHPARRHLAPLGRIRATRDVNIGSGGSMPARA